MLALNHGAASDARLPEDRTRVWTDPGLRRGRRCNAGQLAMGRALLRPRRNDHPDPPRRLFGGAHAPRLGERRPDDRLLPGARDADQVRGVARGTLKPAATGPTGRSRYRRRWGPGARLSRLQP